MRIAACSIKRTIQKHISATHQGRRAGVGIRAVELHFPAVHIQPTGTADIASDNRERSTIGDRQISSGPGQSDIATRSTGQGRDAFIRRQNKAAIGLDIKVSASSKAATGIGQRPRRGAANRHVLRGNRAGQQNCSANCHVSGAAQRAGNRTAGQRLVTRSRDRAVQQAARLVIGGRGQNRRTRNRAGDQIHTRLRRGCVDGQGAAVHGGAARGIAERAARRNGQAASSHSCAAGIVVGARQNQRTCADLLDRARTGIFTNGTGLRCIARQYAQLRIVRHQQDSGGVIYGIRIIDDRPEGGDQRAAGCPRRLNAQDAKGARRTAANFDVRDAVGTVCQHQGAVRRPQHTIRIDDARQGGLATARKVQLGPSATRQRPLVVATNAVGKAQRMSIKRQQSRRPA